MKKEYVRNGIITSALGVGLLLTLSLTEKGEEVSKESDSYDYKSKYDFNEMTTIDSIANSNEIVHKAEEIRLAKEKARKLAEAERIEKARIQREKAEKERLAKIEQDRIAKEKANQVKLAEQKQKKQIKQKNDNSSILFEGLFNVTFYTAHQASTGKNKGDVAYGVTASGATVKEGRTVACPKNLPFGTVVEIEGFGKRVCEDRGGAIVGNKLDVYVSTEKQAYSLGRKNLRVKVFK